MKKSTKDSYNLDETIVDFDYEKDQKNIQCIYANE